MTTSAKPQEQQQHSNIPHIAVTGLSKEFGGYLAVNNIDLSVDPGEIFGFLGPNGAGKTTTIKMLAGLLRPDQGRILINNHDMASEPIICKQQTGYIPDRPYLYEKLTGQEFLQFIASLYHLPADIFERNVDHYLKIFDLNDWRHHLVESYSHGMKQKLIITSAFMLEPPLIIVDEPMVGLDPKSARIVKEIFKKHAAKGGSVFLSTHSLEIAEELCDKIAIIQQGKIRATGNLTSLRHEAKLEGSGLEEIFLELTGAHELQAIISALRSQ
ncbi:MAG: ABC transporter ATP-binding protein [Proteobacteria bacterium]|nr:ABC transporter ATP-binding protein [Pseudomonadota bacterium]MBU1715865.1 ABC transporter ATP-binding protein [Pseudomonadota bacterium]